MGSQYQVDQLVAAKLQNINRETVDGADEEGVPGIILLFSYL